jgi:hypothetical protein
VNISCPLECEYLQTAHQHEQPVELDHRTLPNKDVTVTEEFLSEVQELVIFCLFTFADAALRTPGAVDADILTALDALIRTYRTAESGLLYETRPDDKIAAAVQDQFTRSLADFQKERSAKEGLPAFRDSEVMRCLVFTQRYVSMQRNGRPRGRSFIDFTQRGLKIPRPQSMSKAAVV